MHETGEVRIEDLLCFRDVLSNPATWYITDGVRPSLERRARTVLLTSPKRKTYKVDVLGNTCWLKRRR